MVICADEQAVGARAGERVVRVLEQSAAPVLGVATGSSPLGIYENLAQRVSDGRLDVSNLRCFALDEYLGLAPDDPNSYAETIRQTVTVPLGLDPDRVRVPSGVGEDIPAQCEAYERAIADAGGVDVQILGIGGNGHLGFNEPSSSFASRTRVLTLTRRTREDNARFFGEGFVPTHCVTQGLGTIMDARHLVVAAFGERKADAIAAAVEGPVTAMCPASVLQFHPHATVVVDEAAASKLALLDYYRDQMEMDPHLRPSD